MAVCTHTVSCTTTWWPWHTCSHICHIPGPPQPGLTCSHLCCVQEPPLGGMTMPVRMLAYNVTMVTACLSTCLPCPVTHKLEVWHSYSSTCCVPGPSFGSEAMPVCTPAMSQEDVTWRQSHSCLHNCQVSTTSEQYGDAWAGYRGVHL